jgi:hypothetical protein
MRAYSLRAQSGRQQRPRQLDDVELDSSNKAEAACQVKAISKPTSVPMLGMSLSKTAFSCRNSCSAEVTQFFLLRTRNGTVRNNLQK